MDKAQRNTLKKGCGIGCAVVIVIVIGLFVVMYTLWNRTIVATVPRISQAVAEDYANYKSTNRVPAEHAAVYDELAEIAKQPNATFQLLILVKSVFDLQLDDGTVTDAELAEATTVRDYLKANATASYFSMYGFVSKFPDLNAKFGEVGGAALVQPASK